MHLQREGSRRQHLPEVGSQEKARTHRGPVGKLALAEVGNPVQLLAVGNPVAADSPVQRGALAADSPVQRGALAADSLVQRGALAADSPVQRGALAVDSPVQRGALEVREQHRMQHYILAELDNLHVPDEPVVPRADPSQRVKHPHCTHHVRGRCLRGVWSCCRGGGRLMCCRGFE